MSEVHTARTTRVTRLVARVAAVATLALVTVLLVGDPAGAADTDFDTTDVQRLTDGLLFYALATCIGGIAISSALWAMGSKGQNAGQELTGKKGMILCCTAAFFVGAVPGMVNWLADKAETADQLQVTSGATSPGAAPGCADPVQVHGGKAC